MHSPGYYLHIDPQQVFVGVGMWRPDSDSLRCIRQRIATRPTEWRGIVSDRRFRRNFDLGGEMLVRPPRGFDKDHECIDDIRRKSFIAIRHLDVADCLKPQFQRVVESSFQTGAPFMRFLCDAVGVRF